MTQEQPESELDTSTNWEEKYVRLYADFENYKRRSIEEKQNSYNNGKMSTIDNILDLHNEMRIGADMTKDSKSKKALNLFLEKFDNFLEKNKIEKIQTDTYDSNLHEVITVIRNESEKETKIVTVVSDGYKMDDRVIRYPKVIISKPND